MTFFGGAVFDTFFTNAFVATGAIFLVTDFFAAYAAPSFFATAFFATVDRFFTLPGCSPVLLRSSFP